MKKKSADIIGIKPVGKAAEVAVTKTFEGIEGFLKLVCAPALEEVGLMVKDQVRSWRLRNILRIIEKARGKLGYKEGALHMQSHPRVALSIIENGSLNDDDEIQDLWAGLFASSCTASEQSDENLIFVDILKQLTSVEARILKHACERCTKIVYPNQLIVAGEIKIEFDELAKLTGIKDVYRLDRELDHLRSLDLTAGGFHTSSKELSVDITPTPLALNLYVRILGNTTSVFEYWKESLITSEQFEKDGGKAKSYLIC